MAPRACLSMLCILFSIAFARLVASKDDVWFLDFPQPIAIEQIDPIVSPNKQSSHMHRVFGGSNFRAAYSFGDLVQSSCTTAPVQADKSAYWVPQLYYMDVDTKNKTVYVPLTADVRIYYVLTRNQDNETVNPFPEGLQMLTGSPNTKSPDPNLTYTRYVCQNPGSGFSNNIGADNFNFDSPCTDGMKGSVRFPNCWNGVDLYKSDGSHVAFSGTGESLSKACPWTHPYRFPGIQMELTWKPSAWAPGKNVNGRLIWANGDTTGYGLHGDFINGWDTSVLAAALVHPDCVGGKFDGTRFMKLCPPLAAAWSDSAAAACVPKYGILKEPTSNVDLVPIPALPGCNLPWGPTGPKPSCTVPPPQLDVSPLQGPVGSLKAAASQQAPWTLPTSPTWNYIGCASSSGAYFTGNLNFYDPNVSPARCQAVCMTNGLPYSAVGPIPNFACFCGSGLAETTAFTDGCTSSCPGGNGTCGGPSRLSVYYAGPGTPSSRTDSSYIGCYANPYQVNSGLAGITDYTFSSTQMTKQVCISACAERGAAWGFTTGQFCSCSSQTYNLGTGGYRPDDMCNTQCGGDASQFCGGRGLLSVYNITASGIVATNTSAAKLPGWQGCFQDGAYGTAALQIAWTENGMTPSICVNACSEMGYALAAVQAGTRCRCGQTWNGGNILPSNQCTTPCGGDGNQTCGGGANLERFSTSFANDTVASIAAARPPGYLGCFYTPGNTDGVSNYTFSSGTMTVEACASGCGQLGYQYGAVQASNRCKCGDSLGTPPQTAHTYCNAPCRGNSSETCGAAFYSEVYDSQEWVRETEAQGSAFAGCFADPSGNGKGSSYSFVSANNTPVFCQSACAEINYPLAVVGQGNRCSCATTWTAGQPLPPGQCSTSCSGNSTQTCGGSLQVSVFNTTGAYAPSTLSGSGYLGCYSDPSTTRALQTGFTYSDPAMTPSLCQNTCAMRGFGLAALGQGKQCSCGSAITSPMQLPTVVCDTPCAGDNSRKCGASGIASVYNATTAASGANKADILGCFSDVATLNVWLYASNYMANPICSAACARSGYAFAGTWGGNVCRCGQSSPLTLVPDSACSINCTGDASSTCGSGSRTTAMKARNSSDLGQPYVTAGGTPGTIGCYQDATTFKPLSAVSYSSAKMTPTQCISNCKLLGYSYAGLESQKLCYCDNTVNVTLTNFRVRDSDCSAACTGDATQTCGNSGRMAIFDVAASNVPAASAQDASEGYQGCYGSGTLASSSATYSYRGIISASLCRRTCRVKGFSAAAVSNANQCICTSDNSLYGPLQPLAACAMPCNGNSSEICGSSTLFSIYDTTGVGAYPPLSGYPTNYVGCFLDLDMNAKSITKVSSNALTADSCSRICGAKGANIYGTIGGNTCWCGNAMPATQVLESQCTTTCTGSPAEICGGNGRLSVYNAAFAGSPPSSSRWASTVLSSSAVLNGTTGSAKPMSSTMMANTTTMATSSVAGNISTSTQSTSRIATFGTAGGTRSMASFTGTVTATGTAGTATATRSLASITNTIATANVTGSSKSPTTLTATSTATLAMSNSSLTPTQTSVLGWNYQYCLQDSQVRAMNYTHATSSVLTPAKCAALCEQFTYFGMEGGNMCFCSSRLNSNVTLPASSCNLPCAGDSGSLCGGSNAISLYLNASPPSVSSGSVSTGSSTSSEAVSSRQSPISASTTTSTRASQASSSTILNNQNLVTGGTCSGVVSTTTATVYITVPPSSSRPTATATTTGASANGTRVGRRRKEGGFAFVRKRS